MNLSEIFHNKKNLLFITVTLILFFLLRFPSLFEPYWYGDEGIYQAMAIAMQDGRTLYSGIWDNKPPLLYVLYEWLWGDQFSVRLASIISGMGSIFLFFLLSYKLFFNPTHKKNLRLYLIYGVTLLYAVFFGLPLFEGNIANAENFMSLPVLASLYFVYLYTEKKNNNYLLIAGICASIAFLFKAVGIFDLLTGIFFLVFLSFKKDSAFKLHLKPLGIFIVSFLVPIVLVSFYFFFKGAFIDFFQAAFQQNIGYVSYQNTFIISQGLLLTKIVFLVLFLIFIFSMRNKISKESLFIFIWVAFSLFNSFFSHRPYTHYVLVLLPSFCLLLGLIFSSKFSENKFERKFMPIFSAICILLLIIIVFNNFWLGKRPWTYYPNFFSFITGTKNTTDYYTYFDSNTPRDYQIVDYLKPMLTENDNIFVWGNNAQLYKMLNKVPPGRFTVAYHITAMDSTIDETYTDILKQDPKFIIITVSDNPLPFTFPNYRQKAIIQGSTIYEKVF